MEILKDQKDSVGIQDSLSCYIWKAEDTVSIKIGNSSYQEAYKDAFQNNTGESSEDASQNNTEFIYSDGEDFIKAYEEVCKRLEG